MLQAQPAGAQVIGNQLQQAAFVQPIVGNQPGGGIQREAGGIQNEAGNQNEANLGNPVGQSQNQKGDAGLAADNDLHVLPKPDQGEI